MPLATVLTGVQCSYSGVFVFITRLICLDSNFLHHKNSWRSATPGTIIGLELDTGLGIFNDYAKVFI